MNKFNVLEAVTLRNVKLRLTEKQFADRRHVVKKVEGKKDKFSPSDIFEPLVEVSFKAGEVIEVDLEVSKNMRTKLEPVEKAAKPAPAKKPAESDKDGKGDDGKGDDGKGKDGKDGAGANDDAGK